MTTAVRFARTDIKEIIEEHGPACSLNDLIGELLARGTRLTGAERETFARYRRLLFPEDGSVSGKIEESNGDITDEELRRLSKEATETDFRHRLMKTLVFVEAVGGLAEAQRLLDGVKALKGGPV